MFLQSRLHVRWKLFSILIRICEPLFNVDGGSGKDQAVNSPGLRLQIVHHQHRSPRMSVDVDFTQSERLAHCCQLFYKAIFAPERGIFGTIGFSATKLIVKNDRPLISEQFEWTKIVARHSRAAVDDEQWSGIA